MTNQASFNHYLFKKKKEEEEEEESYNFPSISRLFHYHYFYYALCFGSVEHFNLETETHITWKEQP